MLPLSTPQLALRLPLLGMLVFVLPLLVAVVLGWTGCVPGLHQIALGWLPPLLATLLWAVVVALYCGTYGAGLIVLAFIMLTNFLLLALMPEHWNSGTIPTRALVAGGLLLCVLAVLALARVLGHSDCVNHQAMPAATAGIAE